MPIIDVMLVVSGEVDVPHGASQSMANALGKVFAAEPGRVWVRSCALGSAHYAENDVPLDQEALPVFVSVLHAVPPTGAERIVEAQEVAKAVAEALGRPVHSVHVEYAPPGKGRMAFGGQLLA